MADVDKAYMARYQELFQTLRDELDNRPPDAPEPEEPGLWELELSANAIDTIVEDCRQWWQADY